TTGSGPATFLGRLTWMPAATRRLVPTWPGCGHFSPLTPSVRRRSRSPASIRDCGAAVAVRHVQAHDRDMYGLMQDTPLTTNLIFRRGEQYFGSRTVATRTATGIMHTTFAELAVEARRVVGALDSLQLSTDARIGS